MKGKIACSAQRLGLLEPDMIQSVVESNAFHIGKQYSSENRVRITDANEVHLTSAVMGNSGLYEQAIHLRDGFLEARCTCTLSEQPLCRHGVAALLEYPEQALIEAQPEVVHLHHLIELSPRFVEIARRFGAAVVLSLHDYYFACPRVILLRTNGEICAGPDGGRACAATCFAREGAPGRLRWGLRAEYFRRILALPERVISPSRHIAQYFEQHGLDPARSRVVPNGVSLATSPETPARRNGAQADPLKLLHVGDRAIDVVGGELAIELDAGRQLQE